MGSLSCAGMLPLVSLSVLSDSLAIAACFSTDRFTPEDNAAAVVAAVSVAVAAAAAARVLPKLVLAAAASIENVPKGLLLLLLICWSLDDCAVPEGEKGGESESEGPSPSRKPDDGGVATAASENGPGGDGSATGEEKLSGVPKLPNVLSPGGGETDALLPKSKTLPSSSMRLWLRLPAADTGVSD